MRLPCEAVLFDCDGVLVDSDASVLRAWGSWALRYGLDPDQVVSSVHGRPAAETVAALLPESERREGGRLIVELERADAHTCTAIRGAPDLLARFGTLPWAVVTSGERVLARGRVEAAGLVPPKVIVTADDVRRGKPDPEPYLLAAQRLHVAVAGCGVFEDSPAGVRAARSAGVAWVVGVGPRAVDLDVDARVPDLRDVSTDASAVLLPEAATT